MTQPVALHGLGGVGKTQLAIQYAWNYQAQYSALLWIEADTESAWNLGLEGLATVLGITPAHSDMRLQTVLDWLQHHNNWLLIVDNVDSESVQQHILKVSQQFHTGHWLFTSRLSQWSPQVAHIDLDSYSPAEALDFLATRLDIDFNQDTHRQETEELAEQLGYLPLALEQAAAYLQMRGQTVADYRRLLQLQPATLLQAAPANYPLAVWETWNLSYHSLGAGAQDLMQLLCSFAAEPLPRDVIMSQVENIAETLWQEESQEADSAYQHVDKLLEQLIGYSMLGVDAGGKISVHRLLHQITRLQSASEQLSNMQTLAQACLASTVNELEAEDVRSWPQLEALIPHIQFCTDELETEQTADLLSKIGLLFLIKAQYSYAEPLLCRALTIDERSFGAEHPKVAIRLNNLATLLQETNRLEEAEPLMHRALSILSESLGDEHPSTKTVEQNYRLLLEAMDSSTADK